MGCFTAFDHPIIPERSQGPDGSMADNAGYKRARIGRQMSIAWDWKPDVTGQLPLYARSVNVLVVARPDRGLCVIAICRGQLPYTACVTLEHEQNHVTAFARIFHASREALVARLESVAVPTEARPMLVPPGGVEAAQEAVAEKLRATIEEHRGRLRADLVADKRAKDSPSAYAATYARCPSGQW